ncbi:MAG: DUF58 domain-containing protein [Actinobacteria bacterium]|nr:DUF58 domain-containing protein [Actinomycetota bacterium]
MVVVGSGLLLMMAGGTAQAGWLFVLAAGVFALVVTSFVFPHRLNQVRVSREVPRRVRVGDDTPVVLSITNEGRRTIPMLRIEDRLPAFPPVAVASASVPPTGAVFFEGMRPAYRRGDFDAGDVLVVSGAPFGLGRSRRSLRVEGRVTVVPRWVDLRSFPLLEPSSSPSDVLHQRARTGAGEEYHGVREYRPGDLKRSVHWRTSARAGKLVVREFEEHVLTRVAVIVGGSDTGEPPDSAFESIVSAAASIGLYALRTGHPIELFTCASEVERLSSPADRDLLDRLASVRAGAWDPMEAGTQALRAVHRRGTVVFCATCRGASMDDLRATIRAVQAAGVRVIVVVARSSTWGDGVSGQDDAAIDRLRTGRAIVRVLSHGEELETCLQGS